MLGSAIAHTMGFHFGGVRAAFPAVQKNATTAATSGPPMVSDFYSHR